LEQYLQLAEDFVALQDKETREVERTQGKTSQFEQQPGTKLNQGIVSIFNMSNRCSKCMQTGYIASGCGKFP